MMTDVLQPILALGTKTNMPNTRSIAQTLYEYLTAKRVGKEQSTWELIAKVYGKERVGEYSDEMLMDIDSALNEFTRTAGTHTMDYSRSEGMFIGLPYNIPFVFRAVRQNNTRFRDKDS